jgi:putative ABC transport system permease protein
VKYPDWQDANGSTHQIVLFGYKDEAEQIYLNRQEIMGFDVKKGTVQLGALISRNVEEGAPFIIEGVDGKQHSFTVDKRLEEGQGMRDQGVSFHLEDLQKVLGMEGKINKIEALGCVCHDGRIKNARSQVQDIFSDLEVTEISSIANARENQRAMMNKYGAFIIPFIIISCLLITGLLFHQNVSTRKREIGLLKAMGNSSFTIGFMIIFKAFVLGLVGGIIGFLLGSWIAEYFGKEIFSFTAMSIKPVWSIFYYTIVIFPLLWMLSSWIPALIATRFDAAKILSEE